MFSVALSSIQRRARNAPSDGQIRGTDPENGKHVLRAPQSHCNSGDRRGEEGDRRSHRESKRLVEFARCLMLEPELVVLDEPSMRLDPKTLRSLFATVQLMNEMGRTLLVEQKARQALKLSHHGVVLENGQVRLTGTGREVLDNPEIGALYLGGTFHATPLATSDSTVKEP
jgi:energy-coupling factor transporter ATP-binding protein EcfA2